MTPHRAIIHLKRALAEAIELIRSPRLAVRLDDDGIATLQNLSRMMATVPEVSSMEEP